MVDLETWTNPTAAEPARDGPGPGQPAAFLQGAVATAGAAALLPSMFSRSAGRSGRPIGDHDGILLLIQCGGGNDGLNTLCPTGDATYRSVRPSLASPRPPR